MTITSIDHVLSNNYLKASSRCSVLFRVYSIIVLTKANSNAPKHCPTFENAGIQAVFKVMAR